MSKKLISVVLALALLLGLTSVGFADDAIEIEFWTVFTGDDGQTLQKLVDQFNEEYAGQIKVNHTPFSDPYTNLYTNVQAGVTADIPDVMIGHVERVPKMVDDGILTDVDFLFEEGALDRANYPELVLDRTNYDGYQYGIPWDFNAPVLYVNLDLIAKYDLADLLEDGYVTFDEILKAGETIKAAGDLGDIAVISYHGGFNEFVARYEEFGQVELIQDGNLVIDPQIWGDMLARFQEQNNLGYSIPREDDAKTRFIGGSLLFFENGTWTNATLMQVEGLNYTAMMMPVFSPETALCRCGSHTWMQPENEDRTEEEDLAVATFIDWMGAHSIIWGTEAGQVPLYKSVTEMPEFAELEQCFLGEAGT
ncbi:MAG: extracellular solute-binding protein, partial [Clostridia bacterium]|nr:extracellular solute-binding protein [Clostridia bacterium]